MNLLLISPASGHWNQVGRGRLRHGTTFRFSMLSLLTVAAETPPEVPVTLIDEQIEPIPWSSAPDLVGITVMTATAPRAYEIADQFRQRGIPVVLGGMHPTLSPTEALQHADAIVAGDVEGIWAEVLEDAHDGTLHGIYRNPTPPDLCNLKPLPRHLLARGNYATIHAMQLTRGCPYHCEFCAVSAFNQSQQRRRPIPDIVRELQAIPDRFVMFVDDNLMANRAYAAELFEALVPLDKMWITQSSLNVAQDEDFLRLAARAGCKGLFVGLETFSQGNLGGVSKPFNHVDEYREAIRELHAHGIGIEAGVVFGFDGDGPDVFASTLRALDKLEVDVAQFSVLTPLPGTPLATTKQDRVFDTDGSHYDFHHVVFEPEGMSARQLQDGHDWITRAFYSPARMIRRFARHAIRPGGLQTMKYLAAVNLGYYGRIRQWGIGQGITPVAREPGVGACGERGQTVRPPPGRQIA